MTRFRVFILLLAAVFIIPCVAGAQAAPSFTLGVTNITLPLSGIGSIPYTLTSVNGFTGTIFIGCTAPTEPAGVRVPICEGGGPAVGLVLNANAALQENYGLLASAPVPTPVKYNIPKHGGGTGLALAGTLMLGMGLGRRRTRRWAQVCLSAGLLMGLMAMGGCAAGPKTLTPGSYTYLLTATVQGQSSPSASADVTVTVPAGVVVQ